MSQVVDPYCDVNRCIERLRNEFKKYGNLVIGFDFDETIFDYHHQGHCYTAVMELLRRCSKLGLTMCLYTNESNPDKLKFKQDYCRYSLGFMPSFTNESPLLKDGGKPFFSTLLDDRAGLGQAYIVLEAVVNEIEKERIQEK